MMNRAQLQGADFRGSIVWGVSMWDVVSDNSTLQTGLYVMPGIDPADYNYETIMRNSDFVRVDHLEVAHFVSLLIENPKIGWVVDSAASKVVLLLGRFVGKEKAVLKSLKDKLPSFGYVPDFLKN
jgi:hypothetical protein